MNILIVTPDYPPYACGGGGTVMQAIAQGLSKRGNKVMVISGYYPEKGLSKKPHKNYEDEVEIIWIPLMHLAIFPQLRYSMPPSLKSLIVLKNINYEKYDIIHLSGFGHLLIDFVNLIAKNPMKILTIHGFPKYVEQNGEASFPLKFSYKTYCRTLGKYTLDSSKVMTVVSKFVADECIKKGISEDKILVIPNGIELEKYIPKQYNEIVEEFHIKNEDILILSIARIAWQKGLEYALEAVHNVIKVTDKPVKYMIVGPVEDRSYYSRLTRQIEKLGLKEKVIFTGFLSQKKLQALTRANIFLAPSLHESFGLTVLEAMALGKPVIASDCEGFKCILKHFNTGILVEPGQSMEIANAILMLLRNPDLGKKLSNSACEEVKKYDWKDIITRYEELYRA